MTGVPASVEETCCTEERSLRADLEIDFGEECPLTDINGNVREIRCNQVGSSCRCDAVVGATDGDGRIVHLTAEMGLQCICSLFHTCGCLPHIREARDDGLVVTTYVPDRETLRALISRLRSVATAVRLVRLLPNDDHRELDEMVVFDLTTLTGKQREALDAAVTSGYYDSPKRVSLGELADDLGISKSALSHRLRAAESKLVTSVLDE